MSNFLSGGKESEESLLLVRYRALYGGVLRGASVSNIYSLSLRWRGTPLLIVPQ